MSAQADTAENLEILRFEFPGDDVDEAPWTGLADRSLDPNPFFRPDFLKPYLAKMDARAVAMIVVRNQTSGNWLAAAPVGRRRAGLLIPANTVWAHDYAPLGTPLIDPSADNATIDALLTAAAGPSRLLAVPYFPMASRTASRLIASPEWSARWAGKRQRAALDAGAVKTGHPEPPIRSKKRKELRRLLRRLGDHGAVEMRRLEGAEAENAFEAFLELEAGGWKGRAGSALVSQGNSDSFSRVVIRALAGLGGLQIDELRSGPDLIASLVSFVDRGRVFAWKIAYDEAFARYSPGAQIAIFAREENLKMPEFDGADSLAIPEHSMISSLWKSRIEFGTLLMSRGDRRMSTSLSAADVTLERALRERARKLKRRP